MKIWLDDVRKPPDGTWLVAEDLFSFVELVTNCILHKVPIDFISFDHDLGESGYSGKACALFLVELDMSHNFLPADFSYAVHSANPCGAENIRSLMDGYLRSKSNG